MRETFWAIYALAYDTLARLKPYDHMLQDVVNLLALHPHERVLDVGCGTGNLIGHLIKKQVMVAGVDFSGAMLRRAESKYGASETIELKQVDLMRQPLPFPDRAFHAAAVVNVLHALPDPHPALREIVRVVRLGGRVVIATPLPTAAPMRVFATHLSHLRGIRQWLATSAMIPALIWVLFCNLFMLRRSRFFTSDELSVLLLEHGLRVDHKAKTYAGQNNLILAEIVR